VHSPSHCPRAIILSAICCLLSPQQYSTHPLSTQQMRALLVSLVSAVIVAVSIVKARVCPDGRSACDDTTTCCLADEGVYGCCPLPNAVCCEDYLHCCPEKTRCDVQAQRCVSPDGLSSQIRRKQQARQIKAKFVVCPDHRTKCDDDATCCALGQGRYGCCPMPDAVCCEDHLHCCPEGTECDVEHGMCHSQERGAIMWWKKQHAAKIGQKAAVRTKPASNICTDGTKCTATNKCCEAEDGSYSCCPLKNGLCCKGAQFCCPRGYKCDEGQCYRDDEETVVSKLAIETSPASEDTDEDSVLCADGSACPSTNKCCRSKNNDGSVYYSCCPLRKGVCCEHTCCPRGYQCAEGDKCVFNQKLQTTTRELFNF
ncbi:Granulin, partial [Toxocara canis]